MEHIIRERVTVTESEIGMRFQEFCCNHIELIPSRAGVKKAIKRGEILIDGSPAETGRLMRNGMVVELIDGTLPSTRRFIVDLPVLFEDEFVAVIQKPAGIPVSGNLFKTVQNGLAGNVKPSSEPDALPVPRPVHRLDALTTGILVIAKTTKARIEMGRLFEERLVKKTYQAVVIGETPESGEMDFPIEEKESHSSFEKLGTTPSLKSGTLTLLKLKPHTGRTHQLRIHCALSGFPIAGDTVHGDPDNTILHKGLFLCATEISFPHPITDETVSVAIDLPKKFARYLEGEERRFLKYQEM